MKSLKRSLLSISLAIPTMIALNASGWYTSTDVTSGGLWTATALDNGQLGYTAARYNATLGGPKYIERVNEGWTIYDEYVCIDDNIGYYSTGFVIANYNWTTEWRIGISRVIESTLNPSGHAYAIVQQY